MRTHEWLVLLNRVLLFIVTTSFAVAITANIIEFFRG